MTTTTTTTSAAATSTSVAIVPVTNHLRERLRNSRDFSVSVCIPCRNEAATVASIVGPIREQLMVPGNNLVDELLVFDDGSVDATAQVARSAGAGVISVGDVLPGEPPGRGKGNAMWCSVAASTGDVIVWCDGDLISFTPAYVERLLVPFLDAQVAFVKGFYDRPTDASGEGGGRNTELVARPLFSLLFPELASVRQPLGGEYAARRSLLERVPFVQGYGVEVGLLVDACQLVGLSSLAQVDLGVRRHRHRPLLDLAPQALEIMHTVLGRAGVTSLPDSPVLLQPNRSPRTVQIADRPPLISVEEYVGNKRE